MFEIEYDNPMTIGDYGADDEQPEEVYCKHCGRVWMGYECGDAIEWDCIDDAYVSAFIYPLSADGRCRVCIWDERTIDQERTYITETECHVEVLEYLLCNKTCNRITHYDSAAVLWDVLFNTEDESTRMWVNDLIHEFIHDERQSDFIDWISDGCYKADS